MNPGERFNTCTHLLGLVLAVLGVPLMLAKTMPGGDAARSVGASVFALSCVVLYGASTLFHGTRGRAKVWWQRVDHGAIYLLIAGTYTPFALATLPDSGRWLMLAVVWGSALFGVRRELQSAVARPSLALYVGMGWLSVAAAAPLIAHAPATVLAWLLSGAMFYTAGTFFYVNPAGYRHAHGMWHLFVLGGTASHYAAILILLG
jgi:hemolysin III